MKLTRRQIAVLVASLIYLQEQALNPDAGVYREIYELVELLEDELLKLIEEV